MTPDRPPGAESRPPTWTPPPGGEDDPSRPTWAVGRTAGGPGERPTPAGPGDRPVPSSGPGRTGEEQEPRRRWRWPTEPAAGHAYHSVHARVGSGRMSTVPARLGIVAGLLLYVLAAYWAFTPLEVPTAQGPPFGCGSALSHPRDTFGRNVCGELNDRTVLKAGAAAVAGIVVIAGGFFVAGAYRRAE